MTSTQDTIALQPLEKSTTLLPMLKLLKVSALIDSVTSIRRPRESRTTTPNNAVVRKSASLERRPSISISRVALMLPSLNLVAFAPRLSKPLTEADAMMPSKLPELEILAPAMMTEEPHSAVKFQRYANAQATAVLPEVMPIHAKYVSTQVDTEE